ncbi:LysR substrate-binding domain-containing protein [Variovorax terrae]|uniref:LysR substrate-binding domain-containing protein n=1 Tax=Variovorax terrae TaxID=2923278 RepID=A0A9X1W0L4_9BURK|nr:LysR substrate-binding domain-containing protein [Variovorax terrae]MCJ0765614.1 LysR substrate-binding domain-containing protein [Variovorax terrae]
MLVSRALRAFVTVAEELHFGRAAERLHISQPPLSQQIRQFEDAVGAPLFVRTTRSVQLTPAGRLMLERARQLLAEAEAAVHAVQRVARGEAGSLTLGFTHSTVYQVLPQALKAYRERYPDVALDLKQLTSDLLTDGVRSGRIDVALVRLSPSMMGPELEAQVVARDPMVLALPAGHPLAALDRVPAQALQGLPFIGYAPDGARYFHELIESIFAAGRVRPEVIHTSILPTLLALVEAGMGAALAPASVVPVGEGRLVCRPLQGVGETAQAVLSCIWRRDNANPAVPAFAALLPGGVSPVASATPAG